MLARHFVQTVEQQNEATTVEPRSGDLLADAVARPDLTQEPGRRIGLPVLILRPGGGAHTDEEPANLRPHRADVTESAQKSVEASRKPEASPARAPATEIQQDGDRAPRIRP